MIGYIDKIKEITERLLQDCQVEMIIGFRKGTLPLMNEPVFINQVKELQALVWDSNCGINLANYLTNRKEKIGVIAKGCDTRNIVTHIIENKIKREQLVIIGVPCKGMIDRHHVAAQAPGEITEYAEDKEGGLVVRGNGFEKQLDRLSVLQENCKICRHRNPVIYDELVADLVEEQKDVDRYADVRAIEAMSVEDKQQHFDDLLSSCIRCYACRNACPLCYCPTCFVDESKPQWVGKSTDMTDIKTFHFLRAYHCAGRCTDCGACYRACPMGINVRELTQKLEKDCLAMFDWEAGLSLAQRPPLDTYTPEDPEEFIK